jgi:hypothetical protein
MKHNDQHETGWQAPTIRAPDFQVLTAEEAAHIRGKDWGAGTCLLVGYSCWRIGGFGFGVCAIAGGSTVKTGFTRRRPAPPPPPPPPSGG